MQLEFNVVDTNLPRQDFTDNLTVERILLVWIIWIWIIWIIFWQTWVTELVNLVYTKFVNVVTNCSKLHRTHL